jgi:hypothetical protein
VHYFRSEEPCYPLGMLRETSFSGCLILHIENLAYVDIINNILFHLPTRCTNRFREAHANEECSATT